MGGLFSSPQAVVLPLPGEDSKIINDSVNVTNAVLKVTRSLSCSPKVFTKNDSLVYTFLCHVLAEMYAEIQKYRDDNIAANSYRGKNACKESFRRKIPQDINKLTDDLLKQPALASLPRGVMTDVHELFETLKEWLVQVVDVMCQIDSKDEAETESKIFFQKLYDAICPNHPKKIKPKRVDDFSDVALKVLQYMQLLEGTTKDLVLIGSGFYSEAPGSGMGTDSRAGGDIST